MSSRRTGAVPNCPRILIRTEHARECTSRSWSLASNVPVRYHIPDLAVTNCTTTRPLTFKHGLTVLPPLGAFSGHPPIGMSAEEIQALGPGLASRMSFEQLKAASLMFNSISAATTEHNSNTIIGVRLVFANHLKSCIRMPAGGAGAGGSQQTGFEMELVTSDAASRIFEGWPNKESSRGGKSMSWELRSMEDMAAKLALQDPPAGWGAMQRSIRNHFVAQIHNCETARDMRETAVTRWGVSRETARDSARQRETAARQPRILRRFT